MKFLRRLFISAETERAHQLYARLVTVARQSEYYDRLAVPDTFDSRFDMIVVHLWLLDEALSRAGVTPLSVRVQEAFIRDMDRSLREIGVGDLSVGKQIKTMGSALLGRLQAYRSASVADDPAESLATALWRNIYRMDAGDASPQALEMAAVLLELGRRWIDIGADLAVADPLPGPVFGDKA